MLYIGGCQQLHTTTVYIVTCSGIRQYMIVLLFVYHVHYQNVETIMSTEVSPTMSKHMTRQYYSSTMVVVV